MVTGHIGTVEEETSNEDTAQARIGGSSQKRRSNPLKRNLRRSWAQLTSMRTALVLLFLLALAAVPGAALPQRRLNQSKVDKYFSDHPKLAPVLDKLSAFDVFASPWFSAIYLLLFVSLVGCLTSRLRVHLRPILAGPPAAPRNLSRLPIHAEIASAEHLAEHQPSEALAIVRRCARSAGWRRSRVRHDGDVLTLSAERGQLREVGNLIFHFSLVVVLLGVAAGSFWGWSGGAVVTEGASFCNSVQSYDHFSPGRLVKDSGLAPFCVKVDDFHARYVDGGQPVAYRSHIHYSTGASPDSPSKPYGLSVNHPLRISGAGVYLINHGYAPILRYRDRYGTVFSGPTPFLPEDPQETSQGVVVLPDANQDPHGTKRARNVQVAFEGVYVPTAPNSGMRVQSQSPERKNEGITLAAYRGDTGMNSGVPHSVYSLDQHQIDNGSLKQVGAKFLRRGESWTLDDGTQVTFEGTKQWVSLDVDSDPGKPIALVGAVGMVVGLLASLFVRRRRVFVRIEPGAGGRGSAVAAGGLARTDSAAFAAEFSRLVERCSTALSSTLKSADKKTPVSQELGGASSSPSDSTVSSRSSTSLSDSAESLDPSDLSDD